MSTLDKMPASLLYLLVILFSIIYYQVENCRPLGRLLVWLFELYFRIKEHEDKMWYYWGRYAEFIGGCISNVIYYTLMFFYFHVFRREG